MKDDTPVINRAIHCQNLIFNSRTPQPGQRKANGASRGAEPITGLDIYQRVILLALNDMIGSNKESWSVCQKELAERAGCKRTTANKAIKSLMAAGILKANYKGASSILTYSIETEALAKLQREPRSVRVRPAGWSPREQEVVAPRTEGGRPANRRWSPDEQVGSPREHETVPSTASSTVSLQPSTGPLPQQGGGQRPCQGEQPSPLNQKGRTLEDLLPAHYGNLILAVQKEVNLKESRIPLSKLALELAAFFDCFDGKLEAQDLINALRSPAWKGCTEISWGSLLKVEDFNDRLITQVGASIREREVAANARTTPAENLAAMLQSDHPCERLQGVKCYADRFEQTKDPIWLLKLAAVFSGKGRDPLLKVRFEALNQLYVILGRDTPELPEKVQRGLAAALRSAAQEDELRVIASSALEFCEEVTHA